MKKYIGTKQIEAEPMTMGEAYERGLLKAGRVPGETHKDDAGYHVKYNYGYESWSPAKPFEEAYRVADSFTDRLKIELEELLEKQGKLQKFFDTDIFKGLPETKKSLLCAQLGIMQAYSRILADRIRLEE